MVDIPDVVKYANFGDHRLRSFWVAGGQISPSPIDFHRRPYNTLALPCERVIKLLAYFKQRTVDNSLFAADVLLELYSYTEEPEFFINKKCFDEMSLDFRKFDCCLTCFLFLKLNDSGITFMSSRSVQILALCRQM